MYKLKILQSIVNTTLQKIFYLVFLHDIYSRKLITQLQFIRASPRPRNISPPPGVAPPESLGSDADLHTFRDALARSPLSRRPRGSDLCAFITGEIARHCKRPASPSDVTMSSPTHQKRPRYM